MSKEAELKESIQFALARLKTGLSYGPDMQSSRELCLADVKALLEKALLDAPAIDVNRP